MAKLFQVTAPLSTEGPSVMLLLLSVTLAFSAGVVADNYSGSSGQYASARDSGSVGKLSDYIKGYSGGGGGGGGMNDFGQEQQDAIEYRVDYSNTQARYGSSDGGSAEQQSHISAGYQQPQASAYQHSGASANAYEVPHQSEIDKFVENNFSHQYEQESGAYHSSTGDEVSPVDYHQSQAGFSATQHQHTDVINYVPYPVVKKLHVPYSKPVQIPISHAVIIPVRKPVPIHIPITKQVQVPVEKELKIPVERLVPYPVEKQVPVPVEKHVPYPVVRYVPVKVPKPYAVKVPVVKTVVHKVKQFW